MGAKRYELKRERKKKKKAPPVDLLLIFIFIANLAMANISAAVSVR